MEVWLGAVLMIDDDLLVKLRGPPAATVAVTGGATELFGLDFGVGKKSHKEVVNYDALDY